MFQVGTILKHKKHNLVLKFEDSDIHGWCRCTIIEEDVINFPSMSKYDVLNWPGSYLLDFEVDHKQLDNIELSKPIESKPLHNCICGAYMAGYTKEGRSHSHYCNMYKE